MSEIFLSIIVPAYNCEKYIQECINSILLLGNHIEVIIINDGSIDNTFNICKKYTNKKNFKIINIENQGVSNARNIGISQANGRYITFVDSDDLVYSENYINLLSSLKNQEFDIVEFSYNLIDESGREINKVKLKDQITFDTEIEKNHIMNINTKDFCWNKIYKKELIKNIKFQNFTCSEDFVFNYEANKQAYKKITSSAICYGYRQNPHSVGHEKFSRKKFDVIYAREYVIQKYLTCDTYNQLIVKTSIIERINGLLREANHIATVEDMDYLKKTFLQYFDFQSNFKYFTGKYNNRAWKRLLTYIRIRYFNF